MRAGWRWYPPWLKWEVNAGTRMQVRRDMDGGEMIIYGPWWKSDDTCIELRLEPRCRWDRTWREMRHGWHWDENRIELWCNFGTLIEVICQLDEGGTRLLRPGMRLTSHIHPGRNSPQSRSRYLCLTSIQVKSHLHAGTENCISCPSRSNLKPIQVSLWVSHFHSGPASPAPSPMVIVSPPSMYSFTSIQDTIFASHLKPCHTSPPTRSQFLWFTSIRFAFHLNVGYQNNILAPSHISPDECLRMCIWTQSRSHLTLILA